MVTRYYNAKIYTEGKLIDGEIIVYNNMIAHIGEPVAGAISDNEVDLKGKFVFPSFKNAHSHSPMTFLRNLADDMPLDKWLNEQIFPREAVLREDECYWFTKLAILEYLRSGITLASDMYFMLEPIAQACSESNFRNVLCFGTNDISLHGQSAAKNFDYGFSAFKDNYVRYRVGIHGEYTCSEKLLREISEYVNDRGEPVYVHMSESQLEVDSCKAKYGKTPVELFRDLGLFNAGGVVYHMVHPEGRDLDILKEMNVGVVTCPASNMKLASGIAPVKEMLEKGIKVGIGTDGPASNNRLDMFRENYLLSVGQKIKYNDAAAIDARTILEMASSGITDLLDMPLCGELKANQFADFIVADMSLSNIWPADNIANSIVYSGGPSNIYMTVCNGKVLYKQGEYFINEDPDRIFAKCKECLKAVQSRL